MEKKVDFEKCESKKYLKLMISSPLSNASRNKREMDVAVDYGYDVTVICRAPELSDHRNESNHIRVLPFDPLVLTRQMSFVQRFYSILEYRWRLATTLYLRLRKDRPEIISCEDLRNLELAFWFTILMRKRPKLIYDSHEFEIGRRGSRSLKEQERIMRKESFLARSCTFMIVVNDSIADEVQKAHHLLQRPVVLRSTPPNWILDTKAIQEKRNFFCQKLSAEPDAFILMYHGNLLTERGIETMIEAIGLNSQVYGVILGDSISDEHYIETLVIHAKEHNASERILFHPAVSITELWQYVGAADVGIVMIENKCRSYYLSLPNKLLECVQSKIPIICSDFPEMRKIVCKYSIGLTCMPNDAHALNACVEQIRSDKRLRDHFWGNLNAAKAELCWENEKKELINAYDRFLAN